MFNRLFVSLVLVIGLTGLVNGCGDDSSASGYTCQTVCDHQLTVCEAESRGSGTLSECVSECEAAQGNGAGDEAATLKQEWAFCFYSNACGSLGCDQDTNTGERGAGCADEADYEAVTQACGPVP